MWFYYFVESIDCYLVFICWIFLLLVIRYYCYYLSNIGIVDSLDGVEDSYGVEEIVVGDDVVGGVGVEGVLLVIYVGVVGVVGVVEISGGGVDVWELEGLLVMRWEKREIGVRIYIIGGDGVDFGVVSLVVVEGWVGGGNSGEGRDEECGELYFGGWLVVWKWLCGFIFWEGGVGCLSGWCWWWERSLFRVRGRGCYLYFFGFYFYVVFRLFILFFILYVFYFFFKVSLVVYGDDYEVLYILLMKFLFLIKEY